MKLTEGFRTNSMQAQVEGNMYGGSSSGNSLHEAGLAFDMNWNALSDAQHNRVVSVGRFVGFGWGAKVTRSCTLLSRSIC